MSSVLDAKIMRKDSCAKMKENVKVRRKNKTFASKRKIYFASVKVNQHIYYFRSQTGNVVSNDAIMARLFIGTLKGIAFEFFGKSHSDDAELSLA